MSGTHPGAGGAGIDRPGDPETALDRAAVAPVMAIGFDDPVFLFLLGTMVLFVLLAYLFVRRTLVNLREGYDEAARDRR